ncbi:MAG: hypothetical protein ACEPO8_04660 [Rhodothermaceae bacterium]
MKKFLLVFAILLFANLLIAQGSAGTGSKYEYRSLIDMPSAGILEKGFVGVSMDVMPHGVLISKIEVGVFTNFCFGISYGAGNLIGSGDPEWYEWPGINARLRLMDETEGIPALTIGFDSQGKGVYNDGLKRYEIKSPGAFIVASKNFNLLGYLSVHGGVNYSFEKDDEDKDANIWLGIEKTLGSKVSLLAEYNFGINDNAVKSFSDGRGYLNMGIRWVVGDGFTVGMDLRNLVDNNKFTSKVADRALYVEYIRSIF